MVENGTNDPWDFRVLEDLKKYIFTFADIKKLESGESIKFREKIKSKEIVFVAGHIRSRVDGKIKVKIVNKKKLMAMGLPFDDKYYRFNPRWKDPVEVHLENVIEDKRAFTYVEKRVYADSIDRMVDEAEVLKKRRAEKKLDYEMDDRRGWISAEELTASRRRVRAAGVKKTILMDTEGWSSDVSEGEKATSFITADEWKTKIEKSEEDKA